jgi:hypothetical protein
VYPEVSDITHEMLFCVMPPRRRLAELKAQLAGGKAAGTAAGKEASVSAEARAAAERQEDGAGAGGQRSDAGGQKSDAAGVTEDGESEEGGEFVDPFASLTGRAKKLAELRQKLQQSRKANQAAVIAEKKRQKVSGATAQWLVTTYISGVCLCHSGLTVKWC